MSSNLDEKQQLLSFVFSNFTLQDEKLDVELNEPFNNMVFSEDQHIWRGLVDAFLNGNINFGFCLELIQTTFDQFKAPKAANPCTSY